MQSSGLDIQDGFGSIGSFSSSVFHDVSLEKKE